MRYLRNAKSGICQITSQYSGVYLDVPYLVAAHSDAYERILAYIRRVQQVDFVFCQQLICACIHKGRSTRITRHHSGDIISPSLRGTRNSGDIISRTETRHFARNIRVFSAHQLETTPHIVARSFVGEHGGLRLGRLISSFGTMEPLWILEIGAPGDHLGPRS